MDVFFQSPLVFTFLCGLFGLCIGSFLNVVIYRLPVIMKREWRIECREFLELEAEPDKDTFTLSKPASHCPHCNHQIKWYENIPVFGYLALRGKCSGCQAGISPRYPLIELASGALVIVAAMVFGPGYPAIAAGLFALVLLTLAMIDWDTQLLPDNLTLPLMWAGLLLAIPNFFVDLQAAVIGAACGYLVLWSIYHGFKLLTGKEGMGHGDFKLLAALGAWCGPLAIPEIMLISALTGLVGVAVLRITGKAKAGEAFAFGPWLAIAGGISFFSNQAFIKWYLN